MKKILIVVLASALGACATTTITPEVQQKPNVNLAGFPLAFKDGYADGCASAKALVGRKKDEQRFKTDTQYAQGWRDGYDICKKR